MNSGSGPSPDSQPSPCHCTPSDLPTPPRASEFLPSSLRHSAPVSSLLNQQVPYKSFLSPNKSLTPGQCQRRLKKVNTLKRRQRSHSGKRNPGCCQHPSVCSLGTPLTILQVPLLSGEATSSMHILCLLVTFGLALPGQLRWLRLYPQIGQVQAFTGGDDRGQPRLCGPGHQSAQPASPPGLPVAQWCCYLTPLSQRDSGHPSPSSSTRALGCMSTPLTACGSGNGEQIEGRSKHSAGRDQKSQRQEWCREGRSP